MYDFTLSDFNSLFPDDDTCLEGIKDMRFPKGIRCIVCKKRTIHYKIAGRNAYSCKFCRNQVYPLAGTIFEKTTTPLRLWFYCLFLMVHTGGAISIKQLQRELGVTYKTAWRMFNKMYLLINEDTVSEKEKNTLHKWVFFNKLEFTVAERKQASNS